MIGEAAALATAFCWSFTSIFFSRSGRRVGSVVVNRTRLVLAIFFLATMHRILLGVWFPTSAEPWRWGWLAASSIVGLVLGDAALFAAFAMIGAQLSMLMMAGVPLMSALLAWLVFGEKMASAELVGALITVAAIGWVVTELSEKGHPTDKTTHTKRRLGLILAFLGALGQTVGLILAKKALTDDFSALSATLIRMLIAAILMWLIALFQGQIGYTIRQLRDRRALLTIVAGAFVGPFLGVWFSNVAIQFTRIGIASTIIALPPVLLIPLNWILFRQKSSPRAIIGTILAIIGVAILLLASAAASP